MTTSSFLLVKQNGAEIKRVPLGSAMKIGRHSNSDLRLEDPELSRVHAEVTCKDASFFLADLGSANGTWVEGVRLAERAPVELKDGMKAQLGPFQLEFTIKPAKPGEAPQDLAHSRWSEAPPEASPLLTHLLEQRGRIPVWSKGEVTLQVADIIVETDDVKTFRLVGKEPVLFSYKPGQFVNIVANVSGKREVRAYSVSSSPSRPHTLELTVKRVTQPVPGVVSNWMCDKLELGAELVVKGPAGRFSCFEYPSRKLLFIGAGSGVTPLMSMSRWIVDTTANVDVVMLVSAKNPSDIIFRKELELMSARHSGFRLFFTMTRSWRGVDAWAGLSGHCNPAMLSFIAPDLLERHVFLCGPEPFMKCVKDALRSLDFPIDRLHTESFEGKKQAGPAPAAEPAIAVKAAPAAAEASAAPRSVAPMAAPAPAPLASRAPAKEPAKQKEGFEIQFQGKGSARADGKKPLLDVAEDLGIEIDYQCRSGSCGRCRVLCKGGKVDYDCDEADVCLDTAEREQGYVLACVALPRSDCAIVVEG